MSLTDLSALMGVQILLDHSTSVDKYTSSFTLDDAAICNNTSGNQ